jgi:hypothetical protein
MPLSGRPGELIAIFLVALLYLGWGIRATWKEYSAFA